MVEIAFDTSGSGGVLALAKDGVVLCERPLLEGRRHNVELVATLAEAMAQFGLKPADLSVVHVGVGPGSFTGLRTGCAAAQALALMLPACRFTRVPAVDALVHAARLEYPGRAIAVSLAWKRDTAWGAVYAADGMELLAPAEHACERLFTICPPNGVLAGEVSPEWIVPETLAFLPGRKVEAASVLAVGRQKAEKGEFSAGNSLLPLYPRQPEAAALWEKLGRGCRAIA